MFGEFEDVIGRKMEIARSGHKADKVMSLKEAVEEFIRPGMHLHLAHTYARPCAASQEIARRFWGQNPGFTMSTLGFTGDLVALFAGGTIKKAIATFYGDSYPMPGPNPVYQRCFREGTVQMENWTILTFSLRLLAGALDIEWFPVTSLIGTDMETENAADYFVTETPEGSSVGFARALRPDISFIHGWAADPAGNVVCAPPYAEGPTSARGAREGVIATVEKIVDADFVRRYSHFVKVPAYLVKAVCPTPFGSHPAGMSNYGLEREVTGYEVDRDFLIDLRAQCKDEEKLREWMDEWILGCADHDEYLGKLGHRRIWYLMGKSAADSWRWEILDSLPEMNDGPDYSPVEAMVCVASRVLAEKARASDCRTILAGVGASNLAAWLAYYDLMESGFDVDLIAEVGFYGYSPQPADPYIFNLRNVPQCKMLTDINDVLGSIVGAESNRCVGSLGAGQVDRFGNVNSTQIPEFKLFLVGSGGAADVAAGAREVVILINHSTFRLVEKVPYVTCPGDKITTVVTTKCVLEKRDGELILTGYFPVEGGDEENAVAAIKDECGWDLQVASDLEKIEPPTLDELKSARMFDPHAFFLGKGE
jgi:acyl CoA:acetate/3-ketoacid CoA transferase alpha subunit/acyl CoA:acetate/3-ketoacid CoA transferase beta subunit